MKIVVIVDPYSSGQFLAAEFLTRGITSVCVHSCKEIPAPYKSSYFEENFIEEYFAYDDLTFNSILKTLEKSNCVAVVAGTESGVVVANYLANSLGLPACAVDKIPCLRDKALMQEQVKKYGLRSISQTIISSYAEAEDWLKTNNFTDVVIKPIKSAGTDGVRICSSLVEVKDAITSLLGKYDSLGNFNNTVLLQEYINGKEYVVDTVSLEDIHYVTSTSTYVKERLNTGAIVYSEEIFIHPENECVKDVINYGIGVLKALGIHFGAAHLEIMVDEKGPVLIEVGARLHGARAPRNAQYFSNISQIDLLVDAAISPATFFEKIKTPPIYYKKSKAISLINYDSGKIIDIPGKALLETLSSYTTASWNIQIGDKLLPTNSLFSSPGAIFLANENSIALESDSKLIRKWEKEGKLWLLEN